MVLETYLAEGQYLIERGEYAAAVAHFETALVEYPEAASLHLWLAIAIDAHGDTTAALTCLQPWLDHPEVGEKAGKLQRIWQAPKLAATPDRFQFEVPEMANARVVKAAAAPESDTESQVPPDVTGTTFPWRWWLLGLAIATGVALLWITRP